MERHTIAAYCPVKNCAQLLDRCLSHLDWVDEILIADASDNDEIRNLISARYPQAKHFFDATNDNRVRFNNLRPNIESDFILLVDSDEFYTPDAAREILQALRKPCAFDGFEIPSVSYNFGAKLGAGATQLRLFRGDKAHYPMKNVHEFPWVDGPVGLLEQPYHHYNNPVLGMVAVKHFRYEAANAERLTNEELRAASDRGQLLVQLLRLNWRFFRTYRAYRHLGFAGVCMGYGEMMKTIAEEVAPIEELRMREGVTSRDRRGYF